MSLEYLIVLNSKDCFQNDGDMSKDRGPPEGALTGQIKDNMSIR